MKPSLRKKRVPSSHTPIRAALKSESRLRSLVKDGLGAISDGHRIHFAQDVRRSFADSLDMDQAFKQGREQENRWDYLLGHAHTNCLIAVEPHTARNDEVSTVIRKLHAARLQLREHLRHGAQVSKWLWVASGKVQFLPMEKATLQLAQNGIKFVGTTITESHLR